MNLDDLRAEWTARDQRLEKSIRLNTWLLRETWLDKHRAEIRKLGPFSTIELLFALPLAACFAVFSVHHAGQMKFFVPGVLLFAWTIVMPIVSIRQREAIRKIDYSEPVVALQTQIETLRIRRLHAFKWAFLVGQVIWWIPFVIVLFKGLLGVDLYTVSPFMREFIVWNIIGGVAFIPVAIWLSRRFGTHLQGWGWARRMADGIAGRDVVAARAFLQRLSRLDDDGLRA